MLGWLRTYLERRRRRALRAAKMAAESAEMAAMLHPTAPKRSRKRKWFGLVDDRSRRSAPAAAGQPAAVARPAAAPPAVVPAAAPMPARAAVPPPMAAPGAAPVQLAPVQFALPMVADAPAHPVADRGEPELYGPPLPPARPVHIAVQPSPAADTPAAMPAEPAAMAEVPAAAAPVDAGVMAAPVMMRAPIVVAAPASGPRAGWLLASFGWVLRTAVIVALIGATVALAGWPVWRESRRFDVEIMPIAMPPDLAASGLGPEVAAGRLLDALEAVAAKTLENTRNRPSKDDLGPIPVISAATSGTTLRSLASLLRDLRGLPTRRIAGEVTVLADGRIAVRLRVPGAGQVAAAEGEDVDQSFAAVAPEIWRRLNPLVYAWHVADSGGSEELIRPKLVALAQETRLPPPVEFRVSVLYTRSLVRSGRAEEALATIEGLERRGAAYPLLWNVKAQALADLGRTEAALDAQKQAVVTEGTSVWSHISSAHLLMKLGKPREALTDLQSARRLAPNNFDAVLLEGMVLLSINRPPEALALISRVIDARPNLPGVQEALGNALLANGRPDEAIAAFDVEIARNPGGSSVRLSRANALRALRRPEEALVAIDAILQISPRDGTATGMRGWTLLELGRADQALALFELMLKSKAEDAAAMHGRGMALAAIGRRPEAIGALARVLELQPSNRRVAADLARVRGVPPPGARPPGAATPASPSPPPTPPATPPAGRP